MIPALQPTSISADFPLSTCPDGSHHVLSDRYHKGYTIELEGRHRSLTFVNWKALEEYAVGVKRQHTNYDGEITCQLSAEYNMGGLHVVRRLDFHDGTSWVARLQ